MIEFLTVGERDRWNKVVRAVLNSRPATAKVAVEVADYVLEQDKKRGAELDKRLEQQVLESQK